jgi:RHS repeat-associated protein
MSGGANNSRLTGITYPNGRVITYNYATGVDNTISRLTSISDGSTTLESLSYLGLSTVVKRSYPQPGVDLTYIKQTGEPNGDAGDQYTGLDRFGRVVDRRWLITATGTATDRFQYGYDRDGNRLYRDNLVNAAFGELYHLNGPGNGYDQLNQLTNFARGTLNSSKDTITSPTHSQSWGFDALGNWSSVITDGSTQTRTANQQNEITSISGQTTPTYDPNGNMTGDQTGKTLIFDAWNRLVQFKNGATPLEMYGYDALNRRITENPGTIRDLYYSMLWQVLEEDVGGSMQDQYVWSPVYVDGLVERDTPTQRMYVQQDANFNVAALLDTSGNVQERYVYDPFGAVTILTPNWTTRGTSSYSWIYFHQGGRFDNATRLYAFRHRDFSATMGRWTELDLSEFAAGDNNFYRYAGNQPTDLRDPTGLDVKIYVKPTYRLGCHVGNHAIISVQGASRGEPLTLNGGGGLDSGSSPSEPHLGGSSYNHPYFVVSTGSDNPDYEAACVILMYFALEQLPYDACNCNSITYAHQVLILLGWKVIAEMHEPDGTVVEMSPNDVFKAWDSTGFYGHKPLGGSNYDEYGHCTWVGFGLDGTL